MLFKSLRRRLIEAPAVIIPGRFKGRVKTRDVAFAYRMGAGFPGDVNRHHPVDIEAGLNDVTVPVPFFGSAVMIDQTAQTYRGMKTTDTAIDMLGGIAARPFPIQPASATNFGAVAIGGLVTPPAGAIDIVKSGYVLVPLVGTVKKGNPVFVWVAATGGGHTQGGFEAASSGGNTCSLDPDFAYYNGTQDSSGLVELAYNL